MDTNGINRLNTPRTSLTPLSSKDAPFMFELMTSESYLRFVGDRGLASVEDAERYIVDYFLESERINGFGYFVAKNTDDEFIGAVGFMKKDYLRNPDIGFAFLPQFCGQGYAFEVSELVLEHATSQWGIKNVDAITDVDNHASKKLLKRLSFNYVKEVIPPKENEALSLFSLQV